MSPRNSSPDTAGPLTNRWLQLAAGMVCMVMISSLQHGWTLFIRPIDEKYEWGRAAIQVAFTLFILTETWLVPVEGWFVDRLGPRPVALLGGVMVGVAWTVNAFADSLPLLYLAAILTGIGAGCVYGTSLGNALKWFPDRRGLAAGLTVAGYGIGSAFTVIPLHNTIETSGYEQAFLWFGLGQGAIICVVAPVRQAAARQCAAGVPRRATRDHAPREAALAAVLVRPVSLLVTAAGLTSRPISPPSPSTSDRRRAELAGMTCPP